MVSPECLTVSPIINIQTYNQWGITNVFEIKYLLLVVQLIVYSVQVFVCLIHSIHYTV